MVVGFNHNFRYRGEVFHVQTEDGGLRKPVITTLLFRGGRILASRKTSYADLAASEDLAQVVESRMKEQHKEMLRRLRNGELDAVIAGRPAAPVPAEKAPPPSPPPVVSAADTSSPADLDAVILAYLTAAD